MSRHRKSKRRMRLSSRILLFSAIVFLVAAVALLGYSLHKRAQDRKVLEQEDHLRDLFQGTACEITERACSLFPSASAEAAEPAAAPEIAPRFQELYGINPDVIGWITAGSEVSTAVVYRDNEYYMDHDFYGKSSAAGTVFADVLNEHWETDPYVVLYGHNMRNGAMFGNMDHYMNLDYFKQNSDICLYSIYSDEPVHYVPFAAVDASMNKEEDSYFFLRRYSTFMPWIYAEDEGSASRTLSPEQQAVFDIAPFVLCAALTMTAAYWVSTFFASIYVAIIVKIAVALAVYVGMMLALRVVVFRECIEFLLSRFKKK